ncbi:hypothetical protein OG203_37000 [Nocardia sp. NBC_01499]|uniref:hypothetical protein n=1 Tax=Nocardia sp. NBC_01499 TaxID=2903597 RepID=UPI00386BA9A0
MAEAENTGESAPEQGTNPTAAAPKPPSRLASRWRGSRPLRVASAVLAAVLIGGIGFGVGLAAGGAGHDHGGHHMAAAAHRSGREDGSRMHHGDRSGEPGRNDSVPGAPTPPSATPTPSPAPTH